ncbi:hypothetical protein MCOR27_003714 [Pyricularia oryzae]|uniref:Glutathione S-transferase n=2 Tax=Pyricularia TaxID=48558 RepID=A0ABQ8N9T9_PYRGI|nr:glutathione S-transferase I [Pyricularia oryzae 70-15]KAH8845200.1 hypothetical protein MCOR01_002446 [Pyricularia oryzae]KAI6293605.1 hypothetical protein MCOR33_009018 [Pyricularia grisea]EHA57964.1 glutathione S-transferase I [Pyricularia oryzae 70-15]KAH9428949.1 hypothetical protein MCOR02_010369 [Pyricularia oryzae]KAI6259129.1 hypothetical protein MCOR19_004525 [Pyricularia oryzae]
MSKSQNLLRTEPVPDQTVPTMEPSQNGPIIKLHWLNGSRAQSILWLLEELEVPYELEIYHRGPDMLAPPELTKIHPLGKSPVITIETPGSGKAPIVLAETGFITQYMTEHFGNDKTLVPKRWKEGSEGLIGGETEEYMRCQHLLHYVEGSFMPYMLMNLVLNGIRGPRVPFLVRPITNAVANKVTDFLILPNMKKHFAFLEKQLETSGGDYLCGPNLTAGDVALSFVILVNKPAYPKLGNWKPEQEYPRVWAYMSRLETSPGWLRSIEKIKSIEGSFALYRGAKE